MVGFLYTVLETVILRTIPSSYGKNAVPGSGRDSPSPVNTRGRRAPSNRKNGAKTRLCSLNYCKLNDLLTDLSAIIILHDPRIDSILAFTGSIAARFPCSIECWNAMSSAL